VRAAWTSGRDKYRNILLGFRVWYQLLVERVVERCVGWVGCLVSLFGLPKEMYSHVRYKHEHILDCQKKCIATYDISINTYKQRTVFWNKQNIASRVF